MALNKLRKITPKNISRHIRKIVGLDIPFETWKANSRGFKTAPHWQAAGGSTSLPQSNALRDFFVNHKEGPGIWKWEHYFDVYDRHFHRFRGQQINILEIGIYSGGSLDMWRHYFGPKAHIYGVDIEPACRIYESDAVTVFIGDQGDRQFWDMFRRNVPYLDIVVDDGSHHPDDQIVSAEELLPFLRPGGVYLCEDVHGAFNRFASYVHGLDHGLNDNFFKAGSFRWRRTRPPLRVYAVAIGPAFNSSLSLYNRDREEPIKSGPIEGSKAWNPVAALPEMRTLNKLFH